MTMTSLVKMATPMQIMPTHNRVKKYVLNETKSLQKKRGHCDKPFINIIPRDSDRQLKIECSAGCYELLKAELAHLSSNSEVIDKFNIVFTTEVVVDQKGHSPEMIIKASNRLCNGAPGKRHKFTINMYHTHCSLLINGNNVPTFQDEILPQIISNLETNPQLSKLDRMYANIIDRCLKKSICNPDQQASVCASPTGALPRDEHELAALQDGDEQDHQSVLDLGNPDVCIHCNTKVATGIACDSCQQWNHFECEHLDTNFIEFYNEGDVPYSCLSCRQLTVLSNDHDLQIPDTGVQQIGCTTDLCEDPIDEKDDLRTDFCVLLEEVLDQQVLQVEDPPDQSCKIVGQIYSTQQAERKLGHPPSDLVCDTPIRPEVATSAGRDASRIGSLLPGQTLVGQTTALEEGHHNLPPPDSIPAQKKPSRKKKVDNSHNSDLQQQLDFSFSAIQKLERKIEDLERVNKLLQCQNAPTAPTPSSVESQMQRGNCTFNTDSGLLQHIKNLENEILRTRLGNLEHMQSLSLQLNLMNLQANTSYHAMTSVHPPFIPPLPGRPHFNGHLYQPSMPYGRSATYPYTYPVNPQSYHTASGPEAAYTAPLLQPQMAHGPERSREIPRPTSQQWPSMAHGPPIPHTYTISQCQPMTTGDPMIRMSHPPIQHQPNVTAPSMAHPLQRPTRFPQPADDIKVGRPTDGTLPTVSESWRHPDMQQRKADKTHDSRRCVPNLTSNNYTEKNGRRSQRDGGNRKRRGPWIPRLQPPRDSHPDSTNHGVVPSNLENTKPCDLHSTPKKVRFDVETPADTTPDQSQVVNVSDLSEVPEHRDTALQPPHVEDHPAQISIPSQDSTRNQADANLTGPARDCSNIPPSKEGEEYNRQQPFLVKG